MRREHQQANNAKRSERHVSRPKERENRTCDRTKKFEHFKLDFKFEFHE